MLTSSFVDVDSTDNLSSVIDRSSSVERSVLTSHSLDKESGVLVDENVGFISGSVDSSGSNGHEAARFGLHAS